MRITRLKWLPHVIEKLIVKHAVEPYEVEEVFFSTPKFRFTTKGYYTGEDVYSALGTTDSGRYLVTFVVLKKTGEALIISARDMTTPERRIDGRK
ncbi:MAG: BrnT family toxin [Thermoanaerobaculia bacterium]